MSSEELSIINEKISEEAGCLLPFNELREFVDNGSKRIRSKLAIYYTKALGKNINTDIYNLLTSVELIHNASLLHDDVIDDSDKRRNLTTIAKKYSSKVSILCGDYLVSKAVDLIDKINNRTISGIINKCIRNMTISEINQYFLRGNLPKKEQYLEICYGKTAGLFAAALECSAILAGLDSNIARSFGEKFGICFQINNDLEESSAKEDMKNKIYTATDILGIENTYILSDNYKEEMRMLINNIPENIYKNKLEELIKGL